MCVHEAGERISFIFNVWMRGAFIPTFLVATADNNHKRNRSYQRLFDNSLLFDDFWKLKTWWVTGRKIQTGLPVYRFDTCKWWLFTVQFQAVHNKRQLNLLPLQCAAIDYTFKCKLHVFHISVLPSITRGQWRKVFIVMNSGFNLIYLSITLRAFLCCLQRKREKGNKIQMKMKKV